MVMGERLASSRGSLWGFARSSQVGKLVGGLRSLILHILSNRACSKKMSVAIDVGGVGLTKNKVKESVHGGFFF